MRFFLTVVAVALFLTASVMAAEPPGGWMELVADGDNCHVQFNDCEVDYGALCTLRSPVIGRVDHETKTCKGFSMPSLP